MAKSQKSFSKREIQNKKEKRRKEKEERRLERQKNRGSLDDMIAYVDEFGNITDTPPDPDQVEEIKAEDILVSVPKGPLEEIDPVRSGTVTFFNISKGFGFITDDDTRDSVFVHVNNTKEDIHEGSRVNFEIERGPKGLVALDVRLIK